VSATTLSPSCLVIGLNIYYNMYIRGGGSEKDGRERGKERERKKKRDWR